MKSVFYNQFHVKNRKVQVHPISVKDYTYGLIINIAEKFMKPNSNIVDLGCGVGTLDLFFANKGYSVHGYDISTYAISLAKKSSVVMNLKNAKFFSQDVMNYDFRNSEYDVVICSEVIEHINDESKLIKIVHELLKTEGLLFLSSVSSNAPLYKWGYLNAFDAKVGHLRRYTVDELKRVVGEGGFQILEVVKNEGLLRNLLFTNNKIGFLVRYIKWPLSILVNIIDSLLLKIFGESDIFIVARKI